MHKSLLNRIHDVKEKALTSLAYDRQKKQAKQIKLYIQNLSELQQVAHDFDEAYRAMQFVRTFWEEFDQVALGKLHQKFHLVANESEKPDVNWGASSVKLKRLVKEIQGYEDDLSKCWRDYCRESIKGNVAIIDTLGRIFVDREIVIIKELARHKQEIMSSSPREAEAIKQQIDEYEAKYHELLSRLELNDKIMQFLLRLTAGNQKLHLSDIDEEILAWLKENNFAKKLEVRFA